MHVLADFTVEDPQFMDAEFVMEESEFQFSVVKDTFQEDFSLGMKNYCPSFVYEGLSTTNCTRDSPFSGCECFCSECQGFIISLLIIIAAYMIIATACKIVWGGIVKLAKCCFAVGVACAKSCDGYNEVEEELVPV